MSVAEHVLLPMDSATNAMKAACKGLSEVEAIEVITWFEDRVNLARVQPSQELILTKLDIVGFSYRVLCRVMQLDDQAARNAVWNYILQPAKGESDIRFIPSPGTTTKDKFAIKVAVQYEGA